jgi:hypothetical protein
MQSVQPHNAIDHNRNRISEALLKFCNKFQAGITVMAHFPILGLQVQTVPVTFSADRQMRWIQVFALQGLTG